MAVFPCCEGQFCQGQFSSLRCKARRKPPFYVPFPKTCPPQILPKKQTPHFGSFSRLRVRHLTHCRLAQYNPRISINRKASLTQGVYGIMPEERLATPPCNTTHNDTDHTYTSILTYLDGQSPHNFIKPQHPGRRHEISSDIT